MTATRSCCLHDRDTSRAIEKRLRCRVKRVLEHEIAFIDNPDFRDPVTVRAILDECNDEDEQPSARRDASQARPGDGLSSYFAALGRIPLLTAEEEMRLFRRMNCLKYRANVLRSALDPEEPSEFLLDEIESLLSRATAVRGRIIGANLRLVVSIARRFSPNSPLFDELVSDGNLTLMNAADKFDYGRGFRFSTYATYAIRRELARTVRQRQQRRSRFVSGQSDAINLQAEEADEEPSEQPVNTASWLRPLMEEHLDDRERYILTARFGLNDGDEPQPLQAIAGRLGISKERVRQIQIRSLEKLRDAADPALPFNTDESAIDIGE